MQARNHVTFCIHQSHNDDSETCAAQLSDLT